jgi:signal transduction histidine kinase
MGAMTARLNTLLPQVVERIEDGLLVLDSECRVTFCNAAAERHLGVERDSLLHRPLCDAVPPLRATAAHRHGREVLATGRPCELVQHHPLRQHQRFDVWISPAGGGAIAVQFRESSRRGQDPAVRQQSRILEALRDGYIGVDADWRVAYINRAARMLLRLPRREALGADLWSLLPEDTAEIEGALRSTMLDAQPRHLRHISPLGDVFRGRAFDLWTSPLADAGISILFQDVTDHLQREKELARYAAEAQEANRAKDRFFAAVSHELRTPLNAIVGYTYLLTSETYGALPAEARRAASRAEICAQHLGWLVDDLLLLTNAEIERIEISPVPVRLQELLSNSLQLARHQAEAKGLEFAMDLPDSLPPIETDPDRLRQLVNALVSNAVKFTTAGSVRISAAIHEEGAAGTPAGPPGVDVTYGWIEIVVSDNGPGVSEADRERIFAPFEQLGDPSREASLRHGVGLGLAVARQLAHLLGGELWLEPSSGRGSRFHLRLPRRPPAG